MWGVVKSTQKENAATERETVQKRGWSTNIDWVTPEWEQRHPTTSFITSIGQTLLFCLAIYFSSFADVQFKQLNAITRVYNWLNKTVAALYQGAFVANFNQFYSLDLKKSSLQPERDSSYTKLLNQNLGNTPWSESQSHTKVYFRTQNKTLFEDLPNLLSAGWFSSTTATVRLKLKLFNGFADAWAILVYTFDQLSGGGILKNSTVNIIHITSTNNLNLLPYIIYLWVFVAAVVGELIREVFIVRTMIYKMATAAQTRVGIQGEVTVKDYCFHYLKVRGLVFLIAIFKLLFVIFLLYQLLKYPISGPYDVISASVAENTGIPENSTIGRNFDILLFIGGLSIVLSCIHTLNQLRRIHPDFGVVIKTILNFFSMLYGCCIIFALLWVSWALSNCLLLGDIYREFRSFFPSLVLTFRFFFGERYDSFTRKDPAQWSRIIQFIAMLLACYVVVISICIAAVSHFYAYSETRRMVKFGSEATGQWIKLIMYKTCQRRCFCFTPDPIETFQATEMSPAEKTSLRRRNTGGEDTEALLKQSLKSSENEKERSVAEKIEISTDSRVPAKWKRRLLILYFCYLIPFAVGVVIFLNAGDQYYYHSGNISVTSKELFLGSHQIPQVPYEKYNASLVPGRDTKVVDSEIKAPYALLDVFSPDKIRFWILDVVVLRLMNNKFYIKRHSIPLANPLIIIFSTSENIANKDPFLNPLWTSNVRDQATVSNPLSSTVSGDEEIGSVKKLDYVRLTPYGGKHPKYYILEIYYGPIDAVYKDVVNATESYDLFNSAVRLISTQWIEYNGDGRMFISNNIITTIDTSGGIDSSATTQIFPESKAPETYVDRKLPVVNFFIGGSFIAIAIGSGFFFLFLGVKIWAVIGERITTRVIETIMDLFLSGVVIYFLVQMTQPILPSFYPLWEALEIPDSNFLPPTASHVPGPAVVYFTATSGPSISLPSVGRSIRLLQQISFLSVHRYVSFAFGAYGILVALLRLPYFFGAFPNSVLKEFPKTFTRVNHGFGVCNKSTDETNFIILLQLRWKLNMLIFVLLLIGLSMLALHFICLGSNVVGFSTAQFAAVSGWFIATSRWNLQYTQKPFTVIQFLIEVGLVILWVCILNSLVLAVLLYGFRTSNFEKYNKMKLQLHHTWNLKVREKQIIRANQKALLYWSATIKALQKQKRLAGSDGDFARQIDYFFLRFRTSEIFTKAPKDMENFLHRRNVISIQAHNLTRVQQYITDITIIQCKTILLKEDIENVKEMGSRLTATTQGKSKYIGILEKKLEKLREKLDTIKDSISFQKADFRPDITQLAKDAVESEGRHVKEGEVKRLADVDELLEKRERRLKRIEEKRKAQVEAFEHPKYEHKEIVIDDKKRIDEGTVKPKEKITAFDFIDREKYKRKDSREFDEGSSEEEWKAARLALAGSPSPRSSVAPPSSLKVPSSVQPSPRKKKKSKSKVRILMVSSSPSKHQRRSS